MDSRSLRSCTRSSSSNELGNSSRIRCASDSHARRVSNILRMNRHQLPIQPADTVRGAIRVPGDKSISHRYAMFSSYCARLDPGLASGPRRRRGLHDSVPRRAWRRRSRRPGRTPSVSPGAGRAGCSPRAAPSTAATPARRCGCWRDSSPGIRFASTLIGDESLSRRPMRRVIDPLTAMGARDRLDRRPRAARDRRRRPLGHRLDDAGAQRPGQERRDARRPARGRHDHRPRSRRDAGSYGARLPRVRPARSRPTGVACCARGRTGAASRRRARWPCPAIPRRPRSGRRRQRPCPVRPCSSTASASTRSGSASSARSSAWGPSIEVQTGREQAGEAGRLAARRPRQPRRRHDQADEVPSLIDELPVLAARAALGAGSVVRGAAELRVKESDRITALVRRLPSARRRRRANCPMDSSIDGRTAGRRAARPTRPAIIGWSWRSRSSGSGATGPTIDHRRRRGRRVLPGLRARPGEPGARDRPTRSIWSASWPAARARSRARSPARLQLAGRGHRRPDRARASAGRSRRSSPSRASRISAPSSARSCGCSSRCATSSWRPAAARSPIPTIARAINLDGVSVWIDVPLPN